MEVPLSPELEARLGQIAAKEGHDSIELVQEAVERLVGYDEWFLRAVDKGTAQADRGELLDHDEVVARLERQIRDKQQLA